MNPLPLQIAYALNVFILVPVCWNMFVGSGVQSVFEAKVSESAGLRILVGSLWLSILAASLAGLIYPLFFAPLLLVQIFYKATWLCVYILPAALRDGKAAVPVGISLVFIGIIVLYPVLFWLSGVSIRAVSY